MGRCLDSQNKLVFERRCRAKAYAAAQRVPMVTCTL